LRTAIEGARLLRPDVAVSTFLPFGCDGTPLIARLRERLSGGVLAQLFAQPSSVAASIRALGALGYDRIQLGGVTQASIPALAKELLP
jgi:hypothetical protein